MLIRISEYLGGPQTEHVSIRQSLTSFSPFLLTSNIRVGSGFQRAEPVSNDECSNAEATERAVHEARPSDQTADAVDAQTPDKTRFESILPKDPICMTQTSQRIRSEIRSL